MDGQEHLHESPSPHQIGSQAPWRRYGERQASRTGHEGARALLNYFAYGSNINLEHFSAYLADHGVGPNNVANCRHATLCDYRLRSNYYAAVHRAGACNIESAKNETVEGVVMTITPAVRDALRVKEGWPACYEEVEIVVAINDAEISAFTYVVTTSRRLDVDLPISGYYRDYILSGATRWGFSTAYQDHLQHLLKIARPQHHSHPNIVTS